MSQDLHYYIQVFLKLSTSYFQLQKLFNDQTVLLSKGVQAITLLISAFCTFWNMNV